LRQSPHIPAGARAPASLRANFAATFAGNVIFAASQWAVLSLIAKLGSSEMLGRYALALAIVTPVAYLSHMNLRAVLATDVGLARPFGDYLRVRLATTAAGLAVIAGLVLASHYPWPVVSVTLVAGFVLAADNLSDIYYGALQRHERMIPIARSTVARGLLAAAAMGVTLWWTRSLLAAVAAMAAARFAILLAHDVPVATAGESLASSGSRAQWEILRTALPLGVTLMLTSLIGSLPRYAIEHRSGTVELGYFAAVASFLTVGTTVVNALGQSATPRLARYFNDGDRRGFGRLTVKLVAIAILLGLAGVAVAAVLGSSVLRLMYRPAYAAYSGLLVGLMAAGSLNYVASMLGYVITSTRAFNVQVPLLAAAAGASGLASWILVPRLGIAGAAWALAVAWLVQIAGEAAVLAGALPGRGKERPS
jgi:O-antigen/teichoic acid export membrane protein